MSRSWSPGLRSLLCSPPFARCICVRMWGSGVLLTALPALLSVTLSPALSVYLHKCRVAGSASARTACPICPTLRQSQSHHGNVSPLHPGARLRLSYRSGWMFILYFLSVRPPCHSIFCQFWLCEEAQCDYLRHHLGSPLSIRALTNLKSCLWWTYKKQTHISKESKVIIQLAGFRNIIHSGKHLRDMMISQNEKLIKDTFIKGMFLKISAQKSKLCLIRELEWVF